MEEENGKASGDLKLSDIGKSLPVMEEETKEEVVMVKQLLTKASYLDESTGAYYLIFYHPYYNKNGFMHTRDNFSQKFQFEVKQKQPKKGDSVLKGFDDKVVEFIQIQISNYPDVLVELVLAPSSKANEHNSVMSAFVEAVISKLPSCGKSVSLDRTQSYDSLHGNGQRDPKALAATLKLSGDTSGKCLIFLDDVVTSGSTFESFHIVVKNLAPKDAPSSVICLALAKTCGDKAKHIVPGDCFQRL